MGDLIGILTMVRHEYYLDRHEGLWAQTRRPGPMPGRRRATECFACEPPQRPLRLPAFGHRNDAAREGT